MIPGSRLRILSWGRVLLGMVALVGLVVVGFNAWNRPRPPRQANASKGHCASLGPEHYYPVMAWSTDVEYCLRLEPSEYVYSVIWSDNHSVIGVVVATGPMVEWPMEKGTVSIKPKTTVWRMIDTESGRVWDLTQAPTTLDLSPDGSRGYTGNCYHTTCEMVVLDVTLDQKICEFTMYYVWFERGCEGVDQDNGQYWDIKAKVNREGCEGWRVHSGSYAEGCQEYVDDFPVVP